jgi:hypothetical protein
VQGLVQPGTSAILVVVRKVTQQLMEILRSAGPAQATWAQQQNSAAAGG